MARISGHNVTSTRWGGLSMSLLVASLWLSPGCADESVSVPVSDESIHVELGVQDIQQRIVSAIQERYKLRPAETKSNEYVSAQTTAFVFGPDSNIGTPEILATIGVQTLGTSSDGRFIAVSFSAVPRLPVDSIDSETLVKFSNRWNLSPYPGRLAVADGNLTMLSIVVIEPGVPITTQQAQRSFTRVLQSVPRIMVELRKDGLI